MQANFYYVFYKVFVYFFLSFAILTHVWILQSIRMAQLIANEVKIMINNEELPIGFTMELAQHSDILNRFAKLPKQEQETIVDGARQVQSREEMRNYVESMFR